MVKITPLTDKPLILQSSSCNVSLFLGKISGKTSEMKKGSFNPYLLFLHLKKIPEGSNIYRFPLDESEGRLWLLFRGILRDSGEENASGVTYSATLPGRFKFSPTLAWRTVKCPWVAQSSYR